MCSLYIPQPPPEWLPHGQRRLYTPLQPPKPLPWYIRDPMGALVLSVWLALGLLVFLKAIEMLGRL